MNNFSIVIPSAGRAQNVLTNVSGQIIIVPENEAKEYKKYNDFEIVGHPQLKNLAAKRNWILKNFKDVFMIDDDMQALERVYKKTDQILSPDEARQRIEQTYIQAKNLGAYLYGFSEDPNPNHYNPYKPFMLKGMSGGGAYGINQGGGLYFTEKTTAADSHFITLLNLYKNRYSFIDTRFCFRPIDTFKGNGGQSLKRTLETEKQDTLFLRMTFGEAVELRKHKKGAKQNHKYQRTLKIF